MGVILALTGCDLLSPEDIAFVRAIDGRVVVRPTDARDDQPAKVGGGLKEGDVITTQQDSAATLDFKGGNTINLSANTSLVIRATGGDSAEVGAVLLEGSAKFVSRGEGLTLTIGTPFGMTEIGIGAVEMEIGVERGIEVLVGEILVEADGKEIKLAAGNTLTIGGLVVPVGAKVEGAVPSPEDEITLDPITVTLLANNRQVQVKRKGETNWKAPKKRDALAPGDAVRTRGASSTSLQMGDGAEVVLASGSELELGEVNKVGPDTKANYTVRSGTTRVHLTRTGENDSHKIETNEGILEVQPGRRKADVAITAAKAGHTVVDVQFGKVALPDGTILEAGTSTNIKDGKVDGASRPLVAPNIVLHPRQSSIIHYNSRVPPVSFAWTTDGQAPSVIEVSKDKDFKNLVFGETVQSNGFSFSNFDTGRYYWRVGNGTDWDRGTFKITKHDVTDCANCKHNNDIFDNGERAVVYYQQKLPAITLRWKAVEGATQYDVKVFADGDFDSPLIQQTTGSLKLLLKRGTLKEGKYYWLIRALSSGGGEVSTGRMNSLEIAYDNAVTDLKIGAPRQGQKVSSNRLTTSGEVEPGAKLWINNRQIALDEKSRFRTTINIERGQNRIVYRTISKDDGIERFYFRDVYRR